MKVQLSAYNTILMDASFFLAPLQQELLQGLAEHSKFVFRASTCNSECSQLEQVMTQEQKRIYQQNYSALGRIPIATLNYSSHGCPPPYHDTFHIATWLAERVQPNWRLLLITENVQLMQLVILCGYPFDIYCPSGDTLLAKRELHVNQRRFEFDRTSAAKWIKLPEYPKNELTLYTSEGAPVKLKVYLVDGKPAHGAEAFMYTAEEANVLAKVFYKKVTKNKINNIIRLCELARKGMPEWVMLPQYVLYYDRECKKFAGYLEKKAPNANELSEDALYQNFAHCFLDGKDDYNEVFSRKRSETLELCLRIVRQAAYLRIFGIYLTDYNLNNFSQYSSDVPWLYMWDTDSFCYGNYLSDFRADDISPINQYDLNTKAGAMGWSTEMLYVQVISLLTLGCRLLKGETQSIYIFDPDGEVYRQFVPDNLVDLFKRVFLEKKPFSVELLMQELEIALKAVRDVPGKDFSYLDIMKKYRADSQKESTFGSAPEFAVHGDSASVCEDGTMDLEDMFSVPPDVHTAAVYEKYMQPQQTKQEIVINTDFDSDDTNTPQTLETAGSGRRKVLPRKLMRTLAVILCAVLCLVVADIVKYTNITEYIHDRVAIISQLWETVVIWFETKIDLINTMHS